MNTNGIGQIIPANTKCSYKVFVTEPGYTFNSHIIFPFLFLQTYPWALLILLQRMQSTVLLLLLLLKYQSFVISFFSIYLFGNTWIAIMEQAKPPFKPLQVARLSRHTVTQLYFSASLFLLSLYRCADLSTFFFLIFAFILLFLLASFPLFIFYLLVLFHILIHTVHCLFISTRLQ